jgi:glycosyltransferase involved in cell wall biosynthesis
MADQKKKTVSIIVPAYKVERFLATCIDSLINQTYRQIEIILVDDGSPDTSGEICDQYAKQDKRILVIHQPNMGLVNARKAGLKIAKGEYVAYVDGDDFIELNYCELLIQEVIENDADVVIGGYIRNYHGRTFFLNNKLPAGRYQGANLKSVWREMIFNGNFFAHGISTYSWGKLFKRDLLLSIQMSIPADITIGEDAACVYPLISKANSIVISPTAGYHYIQHQSSMLKSFSDVKTELNYLSNLFRFLLRSFEQHEYFEFFLNQLRPYLLSQLMARTGAVVIRADGTIKLMGHDILFSDRLVIYNSGTFGQQIYKRLQQANFANILWVDEDADLSNKDNLPVKDPQCLKDTAFDKLFIASLNPDFTNRIINHLNDLGIANDKIFKFEPESDCSSSISEYGIDPNNFNVIAENIKSKRNNILYGFK